MLALGFALCFISCKALTEMLYYIQMEVFVVKVLVCEEEPQIRAVALIQGQHS